MTVRINVWHAPPEVYINFRPGSVWIEIELTGVQHAALSWIEPTTKNEVITAYEIDDESAKALGFGGEHHGPNDRKAYFLGSAK